MDQSHGPHPSGLDAIALYGYSTIACHLARLFSSVGIQVFLILDEDISSQSSLFISSPLIHILNEKEDLPYLSSVLINCQNNFLSIQTLLNFYPDEYRQRMAYIECSSSMREKQLERLYHQMKFTHYLCMNLIELDSSTMHHPHLHLICSGDELVFDKLILQPRLPTKVTFLQQTATPFDSFYLCLLHRYSQAIHLVLYAEMMAMFKFANPSYPENLQYLFDWSYVKRPLMRQMILQSVSSCFTLTTINDLQSLLECMIDYFFSKTFSDHETNHLKNLTYKLYQFISSLDKKQKDKAIYELFHFY